MLVIFFDWQGVIHKQFVPDGETINAVYCKGVMQRLPTEFDVLDRTCVKFVTGSFCTTTRRPTTRQSSSSFWPNEKWLCSTTLRIRQI